MIGADGMNREQLTSIGAVTAWPAWSPDGTKIAFDSYVDGDREIYVMDADGSGQTQLTDNAAQDGLPNWERLAAPVGGLAELPDVSDSAAPSHTALAVLTAAALVALSAGGWYVRRRWHS